MRRLAPAYMPRTWQVPRGRQSEPDGASQCYEHWSITSNWSSLAVKAPLVTTPVNTSNTLDPLTGFTQAVGKAPPACPIGGFASFTVTTGALVFCAHAAAVIVNW